MVARPTMGRCLLPPSPALRVNRPVAAVVVTAVVNGYCALKSPVLLSRAFLCLSLAWKSVVYFVFQCPPPFSQSIRANIDEFTETTSKAIEVIGGAAKGKAIIVMNPAEPPLMMRDTVYVLSEAADQASVEASIERMAQAVQAYVPGYRLKQKVQFDVISADAPLLIPGHGHFSGLKTTVFLEVEGAAHYLPAYAGNLDIMTSAALATAERMAQSMQQA